MKILVTGAAGQVGQAIVRASQGRDGTLIACSRRELDISDAASVMAAFERHRPQLVINAAAYTAVDKAEQECEAAFLVNAKGPEHLALACAQYDVPLLHLSTDYVFDGAKLEAYQEDDAANPQGVYGESKWQGEQAIRRLWHKHYIIRVSWVFGRDGGNFVKTILRLAAERPELTIVADQRGAPTSAASIADLLWALSPSALAGRHYGTYHFCNSPISTWYDFAQAIVEQAHAIKPFTLPTIRPIATSDYPTPAKRPLNSALNCQRIQDTFGIRLTPWREELRQVLLELW